jgi:hypothetical protein
MTDFSSVCEILSELYANYKDEEDFQDFIGFNDIGLPLAYFQHENLASITPDGKRFIVDTWEVLLVSLGLNDEGFESLDELLAAADGAA